MGWNLHQADVKTVFLNGVIENEVYMKQPEGFMRRSLILVDWRKYCTNSSRFRKHYVPGFMDIWQAWDLPRRIPTCTSWWLEMIRQSWYYMWITCFLQDRRNSSSGVRGSWPLIEVEDQGLLQRSRNIFPSQRKYTVEILQRSGMMDCKSMMTTTEANLKKQLQTQSWWTLLCTDNLLDPWCTLWIQHLFCSKHDEPTHDRA